MSSSQDPAVEPMATKRVRRTWTATALAAAWAGALTLLALEWTRSPLTGSGRALLIFSIAALPLAAFTWIWLRRFPALRIPLGLGTLALIIVAWAAAGMIAVTAPGDEWLLDGLILRRPLLRAGGVALWWAPGAGALRYRSRGWPPRSRRGTRSRTTAAATACPGTRSPTPRTGTKRA